MGVKSILFVVKKVISVSVGMIDNILTDNRFIKSDGYNVDVVIFYADIAHPHSCKQRIWLIPSIDLGNIPSSGNG